MSLGVAAVLVFSTLAFGGCAARLAPAPGAQVVPGPGEGAVARDAGVQVSASFDAWTGSPSSLEAIVTPVLVTIDNNGTVPLRIHPHDFALVAADGTRVPARGPNEVGGFVPEPARAAPVYPRFSVGLGFGRYRGWGFGPGASYRYRDPFFYDGYYGPFSVRVPLPTDDMIRMALPELVLEPGAQAAGFLYFDRVKRSARRVDFTAGLVSASTGQQVATITIPFVVD